MSFLSFIPNVINSLLKKIFALKERQDFNLGKVDRILLVCQHFTLNDLIISTSLYRALKEKYPNSHLVVLVKDPKHLDIKNNLIDEFIIVKNSNLINPFYTYSLFKKLRTKFDICIVPISESLSSKSDYIARLSKSKIRVGINSFDGMTNKSNFCFDRRVDLSFCKHPDTNISERVLEIVKPFGIDTKDLSSQLIISEDDSKTAKKILSGIKKDLKTKLIGINASSEDPANNWSLENYIELIEKLNIDFNCVFYLITHNSTEEINFIKENSRIKLPLIQPKTITETAAIILLTDLFITNDSSIMHIAGTTSTPQISLFGPTNPFNWAPCGKNKIFLQKSDLIDEIEVDEVFDVCKILLGNSN
jgi:ADP-heptose:LPS heptosyltransferase